MTGVLSVHDREIKKYDRYASTRFVAAIEPVVVGREEGSRVRRVNEIGSIDRFVGIAVDAAGQLRAMATRPTMPTT